MVNVIPALVMAVSMGLMTLVLKRLRDRGVNPYSLLALTGFTVPVWVIIGLFNLKVILNLDLSYLALIFSWVAITGFFLFFRVYIFKYKSLTELAVYLIALQVFFSVISDIYVFNIKFDMIMFGSILFFLVAGYILTSNRHMLVKKEKKLLLIKTIIILFILASLNTVLYSIYKIGLGLQSIIIQIAVAQTLLHGSLFIVGFKRLKENIIDKSVKSLDIFLVGIFLVVGVFGEAYALKELPVTIIFLIGMLPFLIFIPFDLKNKELSISKRTIFALVLVVIGFVLMNFIS